MISDSTDLRIPLEPSTELCGRFRIEKCLGIGTFCCTYLAIDQLRGNSVAIRELFPLGSKRLPGGFVDLGISWLIAQELRRRFTKHAEAIGKVRASGVLPVIMTFEQLGTAYSVSPYLSDSISLSQQLRSEGALEAKQAANVLRSILSTVQQVHQGHLHHDVRPTNVLLSSTQPFLIDPGAAREWEADRTGKHGDLFLESVSAPEVLKPHSYRNASSDLFALCATLFQSVLPDIQFKMEEATPLELMNADRPDLPVGLKLALQAGLQLNSHERPQSAEQLLMILDKRDSIIVPLSIEDFDQRATLLKSLKFQKRQCPACQIGILESPKPLKPLECPACQNGFVKKRPISTSQCPCCRDGKLVSVVNQLPNGVCPNCSEGILTTRKKGLLHPTFQISCPDCQAVFELNDGLWKCTPSDPEIEPISKSAEDWALQSGRSLETLVCNACVAQFDSLPDGRRIQAVPKDVNALGALYPEQWARIAARLPSSGGNAECNSCGADYLLTEDSITLLSVDRDPYHSCDRLMGRHFSIEEFRWAGVGKSSRSPGFVCTDCGTEFDSEHEKLKLIHTTIEPLKVQCLRVLPKEEWHRIGNNLPEISAEKQFFSDLEMAIKEAYHSGQIGFEYPKRPELLWEGAASYCELPASNGDETEPDFRQGNLSIDSSELVFGGLFKKLRIPMDSITSVQMTESGDLSIGTEAESHLFRVQESQLVANLESGTFKIQLQTDSLARRLNSFLQL